MVRDVPVESPMSIQPLIRPTSAKALACILASWCMRALRGLRFWRTPTQRPTERLFLRLEKICEK